MAERDYTPYQQKIIQRYYAHQPQLLLRQLAELVGDLYLAQGKKRQQLWRRAAEIMQKLGVPQARIDHLVRQGDPSPVAVVVKELEARG